MHGPQGQQSLVGADVAGGLFAADVLFAGLQRQHPAAAAAAVDRLARDPSGHAADELLATGHDAQVWAPVQHRRSQRLPLGHDDVGSQIPRPLQQSQADRVADRDQQCAAGVRRGSQRFHLFQATEEVRMLHQHAGRLLVDGSLQIPQFQAARRAGQRFRSVFPDWPGRSAESAGTPGAA